MSYLSLLSFSLDDYRRLRIFDDYAAHRFIWSLFPEDFKTRYPSGRILYADRGYSQRMHNFLVLSPVAPVPVESCEIKCKVLPAQFLDFPAYRFNIIINPVKRLGAKVYLPLLKYEQVYEWFCAKAPNWGFDVVSLDIRQIWKSHFHKAPDTPRTTITRANLHGVLTVRDPGHFKRNFHAGLGRARAFGCGLLQLVPFQQL